MTIEALVTDTHPLLHYFCSSRKKLSRRSRQIFDDAVVNEATTIYVPAVVIWEVCLLVEGGDIKLSTPFEDWVNELFRYPMLISHPFDERTAIQYHQVRFHSDPFDKAIVASALQLGLPLITNDSQMHHQKPCRLFWD